MPCHLYRCDLPLLRPLTTARGMIASRTTWVVEIVTDSGARGLGEAAPLPGFGGEEPEVCAQVLNLALAALTTDTVRGWLERGKADAPLGHVLEPLLAKAPCARHAIEGALIDLLAQHMQRPVAGCLSDNGAIVIAVNALVDGPEDARWAVEQGFKTIKAKIIGEPSQAAARTLELRTAIGSGIKLRVDANASWNFAQALSFCEATQLAHVEVLEQPIDHLLPKALEDLAHLRRRTGVRVAIDEGIRSAADVGRVGAAQAADVVVLKPMFLGGWRPTLQAVQLAHTCGLGVIITSSLDGCIGVAFAAHMAAACSLTEYAHGLATGERFEADLTSEPLLVKQGNMLIRERPGLGIGRLMGS
jgi:o-succinylbenzoate synthase